MLKSLNRKRNGLKTYIRNNKVEILAFSIICIVFYLQLVSSGIVTHDELQNLYMARTGNFFSDLSFERWGMTLMNTLPSYIHSLCNNIWTYKMFTMVGLLSSCLGFHFFIKKIVGNKIAWLTLFFFFLFAQFQNDHNGLYAFSFSYQINICYVLIGLGLYYDYLHKREKKCLICSAILYLMSSMAYEAFILYGAIFFLMDLMYWLDKKELSFKNLFKDLILHASLVVLYVISYFIVSHLIPGVNGDASFGTRITLKEVLVTMFKLAIGLFPLNYSEYTFREFIEISFELSIDNVFEWLLIILAMIVIIRIIVNIEEFSWKKYARLTLICACGIILPAILPAVTNKFIGWIYYGGVKSFGVSYYSYFFIVAWFAVTIGIIYKKVPFKRTFLCVVVFVTACISKFTLINNEIYINYFAKQQEKYDLYCELVETEYFASIEEGAQLYVPDYIGIHFNVNTLSTYANEIAGTSVTAIKDISNIDYTVPVYCLLYDEDKVALYLSPIDENGLTDEIFVKSLNSLKDYGIIADRSDVAGVSELYVNDKEDNVYGTTIISGDINIDSEEVLIRCEDIIADSFEIYLASEGYSNGLVSTIGLWGQESWGRWAEKECSIILDNHQNMEVVDLYMVMSTFAEPGAKVEISCGDYAQEFIANGANVNFEIPISPGKNEIKLCSSAPDIVVEGDPRNMNIQIIEMFLIYNGKDIKISSPLNGNNVMDIFPDTIGDIVSVLGIWGQESWGRWAEKECAILLDNQSDLTLAELELTIATPAQDGANVTISCGNFVHEAVINGMTNIKLEIPLESGINKIKFVSSAPDIVAEEDPRNMNIQIFEMDLIYDGNEIKIDNSQ